jgi:serine/threonine protein kinase
MPNTILSQLIEKINTLENIPVTAIEHKFSKSRFNSHSVYRITDVDVRIKTHKSVSEIRDLHIAYSMPVTNPMYTKNLKAAIAAENTLIRKKIDSSFNHIYFYRGDNGCLISQFTPYSDLFNFSMSDALSNYCSLDNFRHLSAQILLAVNAYHSKQLVHRDINYPTMMM